MSTLATLKSSNDKTAEDFSIDNDLTSVKIGRSPVSSILTENIRCSSNHCEVSILKAEDGSPSFLVLDYSSNGTFVNGCKVGKGNSKQVRNGDRITILGKDVVGDEKFIEFILECTPLKRAQSTDSTPVPIKKSKMDNQLSEEISCLICLEIIHQPISLVPCLHNFCSGCFSDWSQRSLECPNCRVVATMVKKNHLLGNLTSIYLESHPDERRPEEDLKSLEDMNIFVQDITELNSEKKTCRQCEAPSFGFQCSPLQKHQPCKKCEQIMPVRNDCAQVCAVCKLYFCNLYWSAPPVCDSGINIITGYTNTLFNLVPPDAFNGNKFEQDILKKFLSKNRISFLALFNKVTKLIQEKNWEFVISDKKINGLNLRSYICVECAKLLWNEMLYKYRVVIHQKLPKYIKNRKDCRYGKNCRTQREDLGHAENLNHIIEDEE